MAEVWEKGKPNHAGKSGEKYLQGDDARSVLRNCIIRQPICCALLNKKSKRKKKFKALHLRELDDSRDLDRVPLRLSCVCHSNLE